MNAKQIEKKLALFRQLTEMGVMLHPYFISRSTITVPVEHTKKYWSIYIKNNPAAFVTIYINIPYCKNNKCRYCMYNSKILKKPQEMVDYVDYLTSSMESFQDIFKNLRFSALYLGGGTPTLLEPDELSRLLSSLSSCYAFHDNITKTYEISPSSVTEEKLRAARAHGINRISIGVQSTNEEALRLARRPYIPPDRLSRIVNTIYELGFDELNIDLIRGLPGDSVEGLAKSFADSARLRPSSINVYSFRLENTRYPEKLKRKYAHLHESESMARMYEAMITEAARFGFQSLESNPLVISQKFKRIDCGLKLEGFPTVWNLQLQNSCLGLGVHARSYIVDAMSLTEIGPYGLGSGNICDALGTSMHFDKALYLVTLEPLEDRMRDYFLQRLYEQGWVSIPEFGNHYGKNPLEVFAEGIDALEQLGKIEIHDNKLVMHVESEFEFSVYSKFFMNEETLRKATKLRFSGNAFSS